MESPPPEDHRGVVIDLGTPALAASADDFGHMVHRAPARVVVPASDVEVAAAIRLAGERGMRLAARGQGHSTYGRAQAEGGIVADTRRLRSICVVEPDRVSAGAGATWSEVLAATLPLGLTPPVLVDYLRLSVGGTLTVGGVGAMSARHGLQTDHVLELDVVTGLGEIVTCSPERNAGLFDAVLAGLGQVGVITRATLRLVPAPASARRFLLASPDLAAMLRDQRLLVGDGRFDAVQGAILAGPAFRIEAVRLFSGPPPDDDALLAGLADDPGGREVLTLTYLEYLDRLSALEAALRANGQWAFPHPWLTTFVGDSVVESVVSAELARLDPPADLGPLGQAALNPIRREAIRTPLVRLPADALVHAFNLIRLPATDDPDGARRLVAANRAAYERIRDAGGTLYPVAALPMSGADWQRHLGPVLARLEAAKRAFDPQHVLTPGYEVF
jgi:cytokinin dehydrogenase